MRRNASRLIALTLAATADAGFAQIDPGVDTALAVAVDVSQSANQERYALQIEGIARALEDPQVIAAITSGQRANILFAMIVWSRSGGRSPMGEDLIGGRRRARCGSGARRPPQGRRVHLPGTHASQFLRHAVAHDPDAGRARRHRRFGRRH